MSRLVTATGGAEADLRRWNGRGIQGNGRPTRMFKVVARLADVQRATGGTDHGNRNPRRPARADRGPFARACCCSGCWRSNRRWPSSTGRRGPGSAPDPSRVKPQRWTTASSGLFPCLLSLGVLGVVVLHALITGRVSRLPVHPRSANRLKPGWAFRRRPPARELAGESKPGRISGRRERPPIGGSLVPSDRPRSPAICRLGRIARNDLRSRPSPLGDDSHAACIG